MKFGNPPQFFVNQELMRLMDQMVCARVKHQNDWIDTQMSKILPPDIYLAAYGEKTLQRVADYLSENGFELAFHPDGKLEIRQNNNVLATYQAP